MKDALAIFSAIVFCFAYGVYVGQAKCTDPMVGITIPDKKKVSLGVWRVTAYCPEECCCGDWADGLTACGHEIRPGDRLVAAPPEIPFDIRLAIVGYSTDVEPALVLDRGGAIKGKRLDVYFETHQEALDWGVQYLEIYQIQ